MKADPPTLRLVALGGEIECDRDGLCVGGTALLTRADSPVGSQHWQPRSIVELNADLTRSYGVPIDLAGSSTDCGSWQPR
jgi:hypothetical protein